ncbi:MAG: DUF1289 domain-containing protein [Neisseriaceae bacterium]|nr:DUF1289 domain-containing protein [Neisseriaceae bacterium]
MNQLEFFDIPSPCIGICTANSKGYCKGCLRSRDERMYWAKLSNIDRRKVIRLCAARKRKLLDAMRKNAAADETNIAPQMDDLFD